MLKQRELSIAVCLFLILTSCTIFAPTETNRATEIISEEITQSLTNSQNPNDSYPNLATQEPDLPNNQASVMYENLNLVIGVSKNRFPLFTCGKYRKEVSVFQLNQNGEISNNTNLTNYIDPVLSPDGRIMAYVKLNTHLAPSDQQVFEDSIITTYKMSDEVWLLRVDSNNETIIASDDRVETEDADGGCYVVGGITGIVGWSSDSNWLAYYNTNNGIYTLNLLQAQREQERLNFEKVASAASWSPISTQIAFVKIDTSQLIVLDPNESNLAEYDLPEGLKTLGIFELQWDLSGEKLFILAGEKQPLSENIEFWSFSFSQNEWTRNGEFVTNNLGYKLTMDGYVVFCGGAGDQMEIYLQTANEKRSLYNGLGKFACESLSIARDGEGQQHLFIIETDDRWNLYSTVILKNGFAENLEQIDFRIPVLQPMLFYPYQLSAVFVGIRK